MFPLGGTIPQHDTVFGVDDDQLYSSSSSYSHLRHYQPPAQQHMADPASYRLSQQYELEGHVVASVSHLKRFSTSSAPQAHSSHVSALPTPQVSPQSPSFAPEPSRRKPRQKPKIELAPDQPATTQGRQRKRVYVACIQCRTRKIRCDGAKPSCYNCKHRANGNGDCDYDPIPRRRGPDKTPGARQRMARDARGTETATRKRRRRRGTPSPSSPSDSDPRPSLYNPFSFTTDTDQGSLSPTSPNSEYVQSPHTYTPIERLHHPLDTNTSPSQLYTPPPTAQFPISYEDAYSPVTPVGGTVSRAYIQSLSDDDQDSGDGEGISYEPSLNFSKKIWYDSLCSLYAAPYSKSALQLSSSERESISQNITDDLRFLFRSSNYWFSFFHLPSFFGSFYDPVKRETMQPSLILAALALSTFWQSSEIGRGAEGRRRALQFRDEAQSALEASFNSGWIDETLAQASWLLALFEVCSHPDHTTTRSVSALMMLDATIRSLALTDVDRNDPQASVFRMRDVPSVKRDSPLPGTDDCGYPSMPNGSYFKDGGCSCQSATLSTHWPQSLEHVPMWGQTPAWDPNWSEAEIKKESCRRLCWSSSSLTAGHVAYAVATKSRQPNLFIGDPANYALLFSGESVNRTTSSKDSVWALYDRCFLLWNSCAKMRSDLSASDAERADFALKTWLEADNIESALNKHTCGIEKAFIFSGREYLFNTRMSITYDFQRYVPLAMSQSNGLFRRKKAEEWLTHQTAVAQRIASSGLQTITGNTGNHLSRRPFFNLWFMGQVSRALSIWKYDQSMVLALDVCKAFLPAIDYLTALWPCQEQRNRYDNLRSRLDEACITAGVPLPPPPNYTLPTTSI